MKGRALNYDSASLQFCGIIGTGGIGSGKLFVLNGNNTLGREESRSGHFLNVRDYCKQHIILHYIKVLLGPDFRVIPVGRLGDDDNGRILYDEMSETGFVMDLVEKAGGESTLFSFCFYYPDGSGGNLTTDNSASAYVDPAYIVKAGSEIMRLGSKGLIVAAPEVPLDARKKLLEIGKQNGLFCSASFTSEEMSTAVGSGVMSKVDFLAINIDEASALAEADTDKNDIRAVILSAIKILQKCNNEIIVSVTAGNKGSWCWNGSELNFFPAPEITAVSSAGAGDAFFAGILTGLAIGLSLFESQQLGSLIAGMSVTSPDTINKGIDRASLLEFMVKANLRVSDKVTVLLQDHL
jgi:sugar/nucleoside kinase (ribokinase family)